MADVGLISLMVEVDGEVSLVCLPQEQLKLLLKFAEGLVDSGKLPIKRLGPDYKIVALEEPTINESLWDSLDAAAEANLDSTIEYYKYKAKLKKQCTTWEDAECILTGYIWDESEEEYNGTE